MRVILTSNVKNLGSIGDVLDVANGYARNMLIPKGYVIPYSEQMNERFLLKKAQIEKLEEEKILKAKEIKDKIQGIDIVLIQGANKEGRLYGTINTTVLAKKISEVLPSNMEWKPDRSSIEIDSVKAVGIYEVTVKPHTHVHFYINLIVARSEEESKRIIEERNKEE